MEALVGTSVPYVSTVAKAAAAGVLVGIAVNNDPVYGVLAGCVLGGFYSAAQYFLGRVHSGMKQRKGIEKKVLAYQQELEYASTWLDDSIWSTGINVLLAFGISVLPAWSASQPILMLMGIGYGIIDSVHKNVAYRQLMRNFDAFMKRQPEGSSGPPTDYLA